VTDELQQVIYLGSLQFPDSRAMMRHATKLARELARRIEKQKLYKLVGEKEQKKFVRVEGWAIVGGMLGVGPKEVFCTPLVIEGQNPDSARGYQAKVNLIRFTDGMEIGGASAICYLTEKDWQEEAFATHSKTITRATSKAFRLSFAWIMVLSGFEPTPAEEMYVVEGTQEAADAVAKNKLEGVLGRTFNSLAEAEAAYMDHKEAEKAAKKEAKETVFITWPPEHNNYRALVIGKAAIQKHEGLNAWMFRTHGERWNDRAAGYYIPCDDIPVLRAKLKQADCPFIERPFGET
jgi:hypothetical protein